MLLLAGLGNAFFQQATGVEAAVYVSLHSMACGGNSVLTLANYRRCTRSTPQKVCTPEGVLRVTR